MQSEQSEQSENSGRPGPLPAFARADLERLRLAAEIILRLAGDDAIPATLETELTLFRDRVEHALLRPGHPCPGA